MKASTIYAFHSKGLLQAAPIDLPEQIIKDHEIVITWIADVTKGIEEQSKTLNSNSALLSAISDYTKFVSIENNNQSTSEISSHKGKVDIYDFIKTEMYGSIDENQKFMCQTFFNALKRLSENEDDFISDWWNSLPNEHNSTTINLGMANTTNDGKIQFSILATTIHQNLSSLRDLFNLLKFRKSIKVTTLFISCHYFISEFNKNKSDIVNRLQDSNINLPNLITL